MPQEISSWTAGARAWFITLQELILVLALYFVNKNLNILISTHLHAERTGSGGLKELWDKIVMCATIRYNNIFHGLYFVVGGYGTKL